MSKFISGLMALVAVFTISACTESNTGELAFTNDDLSNAFDSRRVQYIDGPNSIGVRQSWNGNQTRFGSDNGIWTLTGDRYCSNFTDDSRDADSWRCYRVAVSTSETHLRFVLESDPDNPWIAKYLN